MDPNILVTLSADVVIAVVLFTTVASFTVSNR